MEIRQILVGAFLGGVVALACAKQPRAVKTVVHQMNIGACHFSLSDPYRGRTAGPNSGLYLALIKSKARHPFETGIQFSCPNPATPETYLNRSIKLTARGWKLDTSTEDPALPSQRTTLYLLRGNGWVGAGTTQDQTNGDERRRSRAFTFCIPHRQLALCGSIPTVAYLMWPKESVLPQVIKLLESIEFIDLPETPSSSGVVTPQPGTEQ
ncbi:conserved hypothetical protein [Paraburkholderia tropica]|uniref:hypothetical protein n=1 Tax=Paraburkholderia tropica TaxID=92647 RepID=UPI001CAD8C1A|nr:hypothetical protein [Paraburkholderia tropica]CAG9232773.1 conserved hypothetical protein [Paraburkholderia tropica]